MKALLSRFAPLALAAFIVAVFVDSLRFKFSNHPNTENIFSILDSWAGTFGAGGIFSHSGIFGAYAIGSAELLASFLLVAGLIPMWRVLSAVGALLAFLIMTGALFFHLFTPLGIDPNNDGGGLFVAACLVWASSVILVYLRRDTLRSLILHR